MVVMIVVSMLMMMVGIVTVIFERSGSIHFRRKLTLPILRGRRSLQSLKFNRSPVFIWTARAKTAMAVRLPRLFGAVIVGR